MYRIDIEWTQRGHNTFDPCGHETFRMSCVWAHCNGWYEIEREIKRAAAFARQEGWLSWKTTIVN